VSSGKLFRYRPAGSKQAFPVFVLPRNNEREKKSHNNEGRKKPMRIAAAILQQQERANSPTKTPQELLQYAQNLEQGLARASGNSQEKPSNNDEGKKCQN
jgi:hypothetical protein